MSNFIKSAIITASLAALTWSAEVTITANASSVLCPDYQGTGLQLEYSLNELTGSDWTNLIKPRVDFLQPTIIRHCWYFSRINGAWDTTTNKELARSYWVLDYCVDNNIKVLLGEWEPPTTAEVTNGVWQRKIRQFIDTLSVKDAGNGKKLIDCISWFNFGNEPDGDWAYFSNPYNITTSWTNWKAGMVKLRDSLNVTKTVGGVARSYGSTGTNPISISGPGCTVDGSWVDKAKNEVPSYIGMYDRHLYYDSASVSNGTLESDMYNKRFNVLNGSEASKLFLCAEAGITTPWKNEATDGVDKVTATIYGAAMGSYVIQTMRAGMAGQIAWMVDDAMHNHAVGYGTLKLKKWGMWNTFGNRSGYTEGQGLRPWFYSWAVMSRNLPRGGQTLVTTYSNSNYSSVRATAFKKVNPNGGTDVTILISNYPSNTARSVNVVVTGLPGFCNLVQYNYFPNSSQWPKDGNGYPVAYNTRTNVNLATGTGDISLPSQGLMVLSTIPIGGSPVISTPPTAPGYFQVGSSWPGEVMLRWQDASTDETGFKVYRNTVNTKPATHTATVVANGTSYVETSLPAGTTYYYWLESYNVNGSSAAVSGSITTPPAGLSNQAYGATVTASSQFNTTYAPAKTVDGIITYSPYEWASLGEVTPWIQLTFPATKAISKIVLFDRPGIGDWIQGGTLSFSDNSTVAVSGMTDNGAAKEISFATKNVTWVKFSATGTGYNNGLAEFQAWGTDYVGPPPTAPTSLSASAVSSSQINLSWTDNASDETGFKVYRNTTNSKPGTATATLGANVVSYSNTGLTASTLYYFWVEAYNANGSSSAITANATTQAIPVPAAPTGLTTNVVSSNQINLSWSDNASDETGFKVYRNTTNSKPGTATATLGANVATYNSTGLSSSTTYYYWVEAYNAGGSSAAISANATTEASSSSNLAPAATATASSQFDATNFIPAKATDGSSTTEWASYAELANAWIQLTWSTPQNIDQIKLFDRVNVNDQVLSGTLTFSTGASVSVGNLPNDGVTSWESAISRPGVTWVRFTVNSVSAASYAIGLKEFEVYGTSVGISTISQSASATASSQFDATNYTPAKAIDGSSTTEWASYAEKANAWIQLSWSTPRSITQIKLFDRVNENDQALSGTLTFSTGASVSVGTLPNDGATAWESAISRPGVTWVRFTVNTVSAATYAVGLKEFEVIGY